MKQMTQLIRFNNTFYKIVLLTIVGLVIFFGATPSNATSKTHSIAYTYTASHTSNQITYCNKPTFFGLEPWYQYLVVYRQTPRDGDSFCQVCFNLLGNQPLPSPPCNRSSTSDISLILLAIVDDLLRVAGIVAIAMVLYSSVKFITSQGEPEEVVKARSSIINALIGVAIAMVAIGVVSFIGAKVGS